MRATSKLAALALTAALQPAMAGVVPLLNFEDITVSSDPSGLGVIQLGDRYKSSGVQFKDGAWGAVSTRCDGAYGFKPNDAGCSALLLAGNPTDGDLDGNKSFTLNFADGFVTGSSLIYSARTSSNIVITLFSELDGKGRSTQIGGLRKADCGLSGAFFCDWNALTLDFSGVARSMVVSGNDETVMLDNIQLVQASTSPGRLPEPASLALSISALGALGWARKRAAAR
jgi:hypothetical protein